MRRVKGVVIRAAIAISLAAAGVVTALVVAGGASAHQSGCHSAHTCPSDHHTYVWFDPGTGLGWDCAEPGAREYDPSRDSTVIVWQGLTYYCRSAGSAPTTTTTTTTTPAPTYTIPTALTSTSTRTTPTS